MLREKTCRNAVYAITILSSLGLLSFLQFLLQFGRA